DADATIHYQWTRDGSNINGATGSTYTVVEGDEGHVLRVVATTSDPDNSNTASATSAATATVKDALPTVTTPTISSNDPAGSSVVREGDTLTASASGRSDADNSVSYKWYYASDLVHWIDTGATHLVSGADEGHTIVVVATATNSISETVTA